MQPPDSRRPVALWRLVMGAGAPEKPPVCGQPHRDAEAAELPQGKGCSQGMRPPSPTGREFVLGMGTGDGEVPIGI